MSINAMVIVFNTTRDEKIMTDEEFTEERRKWQFWAFLELFQISAIIISALLYNLIRFLTPTKIYPYYLAIAFQNKITVDQISTLWDRKKIAFPQDLVDDNMACEKKRQSENVDFMFSQR